MYEIKNLCFNYQKDKPLLKNINFKVESGEIIAVLGPNGAGKTTLLKCLLGINTIQSGNCLLHGKSVYDYGRLLYKEVGYVPQAKNYNSSFLVEDMILMGRSMHVALNKQPSKTDLQAVDDIMEYLEITNLRGKNIHRISGGELQMVLLARSLVLNPKFLILDEPESNLDYYNQVTVLDTLKKLSKKGIACIFNTHYPEHALRIADKSLLMKKGELVEFGASKDIVTKQNLAKVYKVNTSINAIQDEEKTFASVTCLEKL